MLWRRNKAGHLAEIGTMPGEGNWHARCILLLIDDDSSISDFFEE